MVQVTILISLSGPTPSSQYLLLLIQDQQERGTKREREENALLSIRSLPEASGQTGKEAVSEKRVWPGWPEKPGVGLDGSNGGGKESGWK